MAPSSINVVSLDKISGVSTSWAHEVQCPSSLQLPTRKRIGTLWLGSCSTGIGTSPSLCIKQSVQFNPLNVRNERSGALGKFRVEAVSVPFAADLLSNVEGRALLAEEYGFRQIGEPLPDDVTLKNVIDSLPAEVFEINPWKAWKSVAITVSAYAFGIFLIAKSPWYLLPFAWAWTGTAATGLFVIGHECGHKIFSKNKLVEDIVGTIAMLPIIYPYEAWRFEHIRHHAKTNMLGEDTAWHPFFREDWEKYPGLVKTAVEVWMGPLRPFASIVHWYNWCHLKKFRPNEQKRVKISLAAIFAFMAIGWPTIVYFTGIAGWIKFWLMPWLGYHFWMSTYTLVHHVAPHIPFTKASEWNSAAAQLGGTVHCEYPSWVEVINHDINYHVPHHVTQRIPSYNLRLAQDSLRRNWGKYINEASWNWRLMKTILTQCHLYDENRNYVPFDDGVEESRIIGPLRKLMPDTM